MTIASLRPTVSVDNNPNPYVGSTLVGGATAAADDSDATYGEVWSSRRTGVITNDYVRADFDPLTFDTFNSATLELRYELTSDGGAVTPLDLLAWSGSTFLGFFVKVGSPTVGSIVTQTFTYDAFEPESSFASALLLGDLYITLGPGEHDGPNPSDKMLRVYELTLTVDYTPVLSPCNQELAGTVVDSTASVSSPAYATLPAYRGPSVLDLTLGFTATSSDKDAVTFAGIWGGWDGSGVDTDLAVTTDYPIVDDGLPHDYTHTFTVGEFGETLADIKAALSETGNAAVRFETSSGTITFSDVWVQVGHKCYVLAPPLRRYPAVNNGGFGPTRHHPRTVNRRVGGSY